MTRLVVADLLANLRIWVGALVVALATALVFAVVGSSIETAISVGGNDALALYAISGTVTVFTAVAALVVVGSVAGLTVTAQQREYALWQLVGVRPALVRAVVTAQLLVVGLVGAVPGVLLVRPLLGPLFSYAFAGSGGLEDLEPRLGPVTSAVAVLAVALLVTLGGSRAARRAGHTPPIESLRTAEAPVAGMTAARWVAGVVVLLIVAAVVASLPGTSVDRLDVPLMLVGPLTAGALAALGPLYLARLLAGWSAVVPVTASSAWYLARNSTVFNAGRSTATISPLMVAVALGGSLYSAEAAVGNSSPSLGTVVLLMGGPLLLSVLGAAVTVFMSGRGRERESALLVAAGATPGVVRAAAGFEAVIYVVTAAILGLVAVSVTAVAGALRVGTAPHFGLAAVAVVLLAGLVLMLAATLAPAVLTSVLTSVLTPGLRPAGRRPGRRNRPATRRSAPPRPPAAPPR